MVYFSWLSHQNPTCIILYYIKLASMPKLASVPKIASVPKLVGGSRLISRLSERLYAFLISCVHYTSDHFLVTDFMILINKSCE
jgi:hypothetical protein